VRDARVGVLHYDKSESVLKKIGAGIRSVAMDDTVATSEVNCYN